MTTCEYSFQVPHLDASNESNNVCCCGEIKKNEPAHDKTYNKTCVISKDSDQPAHLCSLIRVFTDSTVSRLSNKGQKRSLAILSGCTG